MPARPAPANPDAPSRYTVYGEIASGGMATIQYGRLVGAGGFSRAVAIKRLHPHFAKDESFVSMFLDEARLSAHISHANVVQTYDVVSGPSELSVIMEYVHGESLSSLFEHLAARGEQMPVEIAVALIIGILHGLHAAHETRGEHGEPLHIIHRDVSPENILVGVDGVARLIDFGIARAKGRSRATPAGQLKGKLAYLACEQYRGGPVDRRVDVYGASVVLWEALAGRLLFTGDSDAAVVAAVLNAPVLPPSQFHSEVPEALDRIVLKGISRDVDERYGTAREMALALEREVGGTTHSAVSDWLERVAGETLARRERLLNEMRARGAGGTATMATELGSTRPVDVSALTQQATFDSTPASRPPVSRSGLRARPGARSRIGLMMAIAFLVIIGAWAFFDAITRETPTSAPAATPQPTPPAPEPAKGTETPQDAPKAPGDPAPRAADAPPTEEPELAAPKREDEARKPKRNTSRSGSATKRKVDCRYPFTIDPLGIRHVKPECLD